MRREHFIFVGAPGGEIASSLCQILQSWKYEDVTLKVGQIELVATDPAFRRRGLVRAQMALYDELLDQHDCVLSCVQGIPGVYQRFGYEYAVPFKGGARFWLGQLSSLSAPQTYLIRPFKEGDTASVSALYDAEMRPLMISAERDAGLWRYQETQPADSEHAYETYVLEREGRVTGYFRLPVRSKGSALIIRELSVESYDALLQVLDFSRERAARSSFESIILQLPAIHPAIEAVRYLGAQTLTPFAWQVRVVNWVRFLERIAPVLERRLSASLLKSWTGVLPFNLIGGGTIKLTVSDGRVAEVEYGEEVREWSVEAPPGLLCQLFLGFRSSRELVEWHPNFQVRPDAQLLVDTLFPQRASFVYEAY